MDEDQVIKALSRHLNSVDLNTRSGLVDFWNHEADWDKIATEVIKYLRELKVLDW